MTSKVLVIAEHENATLSPLTLNTISAALKVTSACDLIICGINLQNIAKTAANLEGVKNVYTAEHEKLAHALAEPVTHVVVEHIKAHSYTHVMVAASTFGKNILPRIAAHLNVAALSDVIALYPENIYERPIYAGNAILKCQSLDSIQCLTVRHTAFDSISSNPKSTPSPIHTVDVSYLAQSTVRQCEFVDLKASVSERPDLSSARIVVSGGRGLGSKDNFQLIEKIADKLGAAVGASRAAVDAGYVPNDYQVGQTGKIVAPELYIAVGISGAIQHLAGMKDSKVIVAINKDSDAPIFEIADYGLVGDLFTILPELEKALS